MDMWPTKYNLLHILSALFFALHLNGQQFSDPERPYEPLVWSDQEDVPPPIAWYHTMYDSTALELGSDGYNILQILTDSRDEQLVADDLVINVISREGQGVSKGTLLEAYNVQTGDLQWQTIIQAPDGESEMTTRRVRIIDDRLQVMSIQRKGLSGQLDFFSLNISADSCKVLVWDINIGSGIVLDTHTVANELAFTVENRFSKIAMVTSHFLWDQDSVLYYEYNREQPNQVQRARLGLDGTGSSFDILPHGNRAGSFDLHPWRDDLLLMFDHYDDGIFLTPVDRNLEFVGNNVSIPVTHPSSFVYLAELDDGTIVVLDQFQDQSRWHVFTSDLDYVTTIDVPANTNSQVFSYRGKLYTLVGKASVAEGGLELYEITDDSLVLQYEWLIEDGRSFVPRVVSVEDDLLIVLGNEGAERLSQPGQFDSAAKAASTVAIDLSQLSLLTTTSEVETTTATMTIYPNPASNGVATVSLEESDRLSVYDMSGRIVSRSQTLQHTHEVSTAALGVGVYIVKSDRGATDRLVITE